MMCLKMNLVIFALTYLPLVSHILATPDLLHEKCAVLSSECLKTQLRKTMQTLLDGIPALGIEGLEKMKLDIVEMKKDGLIYIMKNIEFDGFRNAVIDSFSIDMKLKFIKLSFHTSLKMECDYTAEGDLFTIPVAGAGKAILTKENVNIDLLYKFDIKETEDQKNTIDLLSYYYSVEVRDGGTYYYENVYDGDKEKSETLHNFMNTNWKIITNSHERFLFNKINDKIFDAVKIYLRTVPFEHIAVLNKMNQEESDSNSSLPYIFHCLKDNDI